MKKVLIAGMLIIFAIVLFASSISPKSSFLGDRKKGFGVEVTTGGDINFLPKTTVGTTNLGNSGTLESVYELCDSLQTFVADGLLIDADIAISAVAAEKFKTTATSYYTINGVQYNKSATDNLTFSAAHTINVGDSTGTYYGIILLQINGAGTVSSKVPATDQNYTTSALALAALPDPDASNVSLGHILISTIADNSWTANTDDMTDLSDVTAAVFTDYDEKVLPGSR